MRKLLGILQFIALFGAFLFLFTSFTNASPDGLTLTAPLSCPTGGCAAGQRLNFRIDFSLSPVYQGGSNTQVCIYAPTYGQPPGASPWTDLSNSWISSSGLLTEVVYSEGQIASICSDNASPTDSFISGAFAKHSAAVSDQIDFAININPITAIDGDITVKILQAKADGSSWTVSSSFTQTIDVTPRALTAYVAKTPAECESFEPCYVNSGDDQESGIGTGLRDAILSISTGNEIRILKNYVIKNNTILIDKNLAIIGQDTAALSTIGADCSQPMLRFTHGGSLSGLTINDGNCSTPTSRNLIEVDSAEDVVIEHNTFTSGQRAINIKNNAADVTVAFNHLTGNYDYAVFRETGTGDNGWVNLYGNNIFNNRSGVQVFCGGYGGANNNFWGAGESVSDCNLSNGKLLGAMILQNDNGAGVQGIRKTVTDTMTYAFNNQIGVAHKPGDPNFDVIIINHGQGAESNIPFRDSGAGTLKACSNFYDVFLSNDAVALNLDLAIKYDLNQTCTNTIESNEYCGQSDSSKYPLWWYDPANDVTDGWNTTGQTPNGTGSGNGAGQTTTCNTNKKEIKVAIDTSGRPGINMDLNFTPFVVGLPINDGVTLTRLTAVFDVNKVSLNWITSSETNIKGFYVLRSEKENGVYSRISPQINAIGDSYIGGIYNFSDTDVTFTRTYYYKIEVISEQGTSIQHLGPVSVLTATPTPTVTRTLTPTLTRTLFPTYTSFPTRYVTPSYRTPTPINFSTATPDGRPTQVRTYGPTSTGEGSYPDGGPDFPDSAYPIRTAYPDGYPAPENGADETATSDVGEGGGYPIEPEVTPTSTPASPADDQDELATRSLRWFFILIGAACGLGILGAIGAILIRKYLI